MVEAGVPLAQALSQLSEAEAPVFKKIILQVSEDISMGSTFSDAISRHSGAFNNMYCSIVRSGEISGALDEVLDQIATYMENIEAMRQKVKGAMRYPMFIGGFISLMLIGIMWKLVPTFENMYGSFNAKLPLPTEILIFISHIVRDQIVFLFAGIIASIIAYTMLMNVEGFKGFIHRAMLYMPVFGMIMKKNIWANFARTMSLLMHSGTPILQATEIAGAVVGNKVYAASLEKVYSNLQTGMLLSQSLKETGLYPVLVTQLISTGEESGKVDVLLKKAAEFYEREIKVTVDSLAAIIEPFMIIILGGLVGGILIALYMPIFMIGELMTGTH
jgi:type IV pilus assembly protein PilC